MSVDYNAINWGDLVYYDEASPTFLRWKIERRGGRGVNGYLIRAIGDIAGSICKTDLYPRTMLYGKMYYNHRIIWVLFNGSIDSEKQIDHIDGNKQNNCISNLRLVTEAVNQRNRVLHSNNKTGVVGVRLMSAYNNSENNYYVASWIDINNKNKSKAFSIPKLGESEAFRLACEYREKMIEELNAQGAGYTERHGT